MIITISFNYGRITNEDDNSSNSSIVSEHNFPTFPSINTTQTIREQLSHIACKYLFNARTYTIDDKK